MPINVNQNQNPQNHSFVGNNANQQGKNLDFFSPQKISESEFWEIKQAAVNGDGESKYKMGYIQENGKFEQPNLQSAASWYQQAVQRGHKESLNRLTGLAEKGDAFAQFNLAITYEKGTGVEQNYKEAAKWYEKVANQKGHHNASLAQFHLAECYYYGLGVDQNRPKALALYTEAANEEHPEALYRLGCIYKNKYNDAVQRSRRNAQTHKDLQLAYEWLNKSVKKRYSEEANYFLKKVIFALEQINLGTWDKVEPKKRS